MRIRRVLLALALVGVTWCATLIAGLLGGFRLLPIAVAAPVAAVLVLPAFVVSVVDNRNSPRGKLRLWLAGLPRWVPWAAAASFLLFWLAGVTAFIGLGGNASIRDGQYVLDNHGEVTVVDKSTYDRQLDQEQRLVLGGFGAFGVGGATLATIRLRE